MGGTAGGRSIRAKVADLEQRVRSVESFCAMVRDGALANLEKILAEIDRRVRKIMTGKATQAQINRLVREIRRFVADCLAIVAGVQTAMAGIHLQS